MSREYIMSKAGIIAKRICDILDQPQPEDIIIGGEQESFEFTDSSYVMNIPEEDAGSEVDLALDIAILAHTARQYRCNPDQLDHLESLIFGLMYVVEYYMLDYEVSSLPDEAATIFENIKDSCKCFSDVCYSQSDSSIYVDRTKCSDEPAEMVWNMSEEQWAAFCSDYITVTEGAESDADPEALELSKYFDGDIYGTLTCGSMRAVFAFADFSEEGPMALILAKGIDDGNSSSTDADYPYAIAGTGFIAPARCSSFDDFKAECEQKLLNIDFDSGMLKGLPVAGCAKNISMLLAGKNGSWVSESYEGPIMLNGDEH